MKSFRPALVLALAAFCEAAPTTQTFDGGGTAYLKREADAQKGAAVISGGPYGSFLRLATAAAGSINSIAFDRTDGIVNTVVIESDLRMAPPPGATRQGAADGMGLAFLNAAHYGSAGPVYNSIPEQPLFTKSLAVGFRIYGMNRIYVNYDGALVASKEVSGSLDLANGQFFRARITIRLSNADVSVVLTPSGGSAITVFDQLPVPGLTPYAGRVWAGARSGGLSALQDIDNVNAVFTPAAVTQLPFMQYLRSASARMVSYSPTNFNPARIAPGGALLRTPTAASITGDLAAIRPGFNGLILYGSPKDQLDNGQGLTDWILFEARRFGFAAVVIGIWDPLDQTEIDAAAALVTKYGTSASFSLAICLGNEGILRKHEGKQRPAYVIYELPDLNAARTYLLGKLAGAPVPIATSEDLARYTAVPDLLFWGDFLFPILVPHWNVPSLGPAAAALWVRDQGAALIEKAGLVTVLKEPAWPSAGLAHYTPETQRQFFASYLSGPRTSPSVKFPDVFVAYHTVLEGFDQYWKQGQDKDWGLFTENRVAKPAFAEFASSSTPAAFTAAPSSLQFSYQLGSGAANPLAQTVTVTNAAGVWAFDAVANASWLSVLPSTGATAASLSITVNPLGLSPGNYTSSVTVSGANSASAVVNVTFTVTASAGGGGGGGGGTSAGLLYVPLLPCRVADTREDLGDFGRPVLAAGETRTFFIPRSRCNIPASARAYWVNITVVPRGQLGYLTVFPAGAAQPFVSTLNSMDGRVKANAALVPAGLNGGISVFVTGSTEVIIDILGSFVDAAANPQALAFYPLPPCRIADTRNPNGALGGPVMAANQSRSFPVLSSNCGIPATAQALSLAATVVPQGRLGHLTLWPTGQPQPFVSTLNAPTGATVANAAFIPSGVNGAVSAFVTDQAHLILDINGYFAPPGAAGALRLFTVPPCRLLDTRGPEGEFGGPILAVNQERSYRFPLTACGLPNSVNAYSLNATVVPLTILGHLTLWPTGSQQPFVSTLNASDDPIVASAAITPAGTAGGVSSYVTNASHLVIDTNGFFAP